MIATDDLEQRLVASAQAGDEHAFGQLVAAHRPRVYRVAMLYVHDHATADEVTHLAFVRLFQALPHFRHESALSTWLHRVTLNLCRDAARRQRRDRRLVPLSLVRDIADTTGAAAPDLTVIAASTDAEVRDAVRQLPDDLRELVALRFGADQTHAQMAAALGVPLGTVCTRMQRALRRLAVQLAPSSETRR